MKKNKQNVYYNAIGASGAVSSILYTYILFYPFSSIGVFFIPMPAWIFGIVYLILEYYLSKRQSTLIAHDAHYYGAIFGIVFTIVIYPKVLLNILTILNS